MKFKAKDAKIFVNGAELKNINDSNFLRNDNNRLLNEIYELKNKIKKLEHFRDTTVGLWATDKPNLIPDNLKEKYFLFEIKD